MVDTCVITSIHMSILLVVFI